jgi:predicted acyl esterase
MNGAAANCAGVMDERDIVVPMRNGARLAVEVHRPSAPRKFPVLYTCGIRGEDFQPSLVAAAVPPHGAVDEACAQPWHYQASFKGGNLHVP